MASKIEILVTPGCPHAGETEALLRDAVRRLAPGAKISRTVVEDASGAAALGFPGSPTIRIDGEDLEGSLAGPAAFAESIG